MKSREERQYYEYLEKIIREQKARSGFWSRSTNSYEMDMIMLLNHIQKKNPHLMDRIVSNFVDTTSMESCSKQDILTFMGRTEKGTICKWKNEDGQEVYLVNNGERFLSRTKQILVFGSSMNRGDLELLRKSLYGSVLRKDIQKVYEKIAREERMRQEREADGKKKSFISTIKERRERIAEHSASAFERNFKLLVREQGPLCIPRATADTMLAFMPGTERSKLAKGLSSIGVTSAAAWERLLGRWKEEALNPEIAVERSYKRTVRPRTVEIYHSR